MFLSEKYISSVKGRRKLPEVMDMFTAQTVLIISWLYTYLQIHQVACIKYVQFFYVNHAPVKQQENLWDFPKKHSKAGF